MLTTLALGVLSSVVAEFVTWVNSKLSSTVLKGDGAFLVAAFISLVIASVKVWMAGDFVLTNWTDIAMLGTAFAQIWAISQVVFLGVIQMFNLDVSSGPTTNTVVGPAQ